ncbi:MAG: efflux RND transporter periplasmic adaptor subunit [Kiritimatiellaeota bacterium]|nr:efflux RND transporter periplasmic adaptor subunit [Kiritimatiellota bacterium]
MKTALKKLWKPVVGVAGLAALIAYTGGACQAKVKPGTVAHAPGTALPPNAATLTIKSEPVAPRIEVVGTVTSERIINLSARLSAYVQEMNVSAGSVVKKDQVLATLDDREIREQLTGAEGQLKQAEKELQRARDLFREKATTEQMVTAAESAYTGAKSQAERVRVMLSYAQITAPLDGIVTDRRLEAGDLANPGQVLMAVYDPTRMRLDAPVPVRLIERLAVGQDVAVQLERPAASLPGRITEIVSEVDPQSRTQTVKVRLDHAPAGTLPGAFGRLLVLDAPRPALLIPAAAVTTSGQLELVSVVSDGRVIQRLVKTGPANDGRVEVLSGLAAGEVILVQPLPEN